MPKGVAAPVFTDRKKGFEFVNQPREFLVRIEFCAVFVHEQSLAGSLLDSFPQDAFEARRDTNKAFPTIL